MSKPIPQPNYTQVPNLLFDDLLSTIGEAELKVVLWIARKTFGWHKDSDQISLSQLMTATGMSRQGVLNGIENGISHGLIGRIPHGQSFLYFLVVNEVDQSTTLTSASLQSRPEVVNEVDTQKKTKDNLNKKEFSGRPLTAWQQQVKEMSEAIATVTGDDLNIEQIKRRVAQISAQLLKAGYLPADLPAFHGYWKTRDWRGKQGQAPTRQQVLEELPKAKRAQQKALTIKQPDQAQIDFVNRKRAEKEAREQNGEIPHD